MDDHKLPGQALLKNYLEANKISRAEFARRTAEHGQAIDRVTIVNLILGDPKRVEVGAALAIEAASNGEVPAASWTRGWDSTETRAAQRGAA